MIGMCFGCIYRIKSIVTSCSSCQSTCRSNGKKLMTSSTMGIMVEMLATKMMARMQCNGDNVERLTMINTRFTGTIGQIPVCLS